MSSYTPLQLAHAFLQTGELTDAYTALQDHLTQNSTDHDSRRLLVSVGMRIDNNLQGCLVELEKIPDWTVQDYVQSSVLYEKMGDLDSAIQAMQQARKLSQEERLAERLLKLLIEAEQFSEAITLIQQQPQTWQWQQWLGDVYVLQGDDDMALDVYANALDQLNHVSTPTNEIIESCKGRIQIARAHAYRHLGQLNEAKATYAIAQQHFPDDASIQFYRGLVDFSQGKVEQAVAGCQRAFTKIALNIQQKLLDDLQLDEQYQKLYQHLAKF